MKTPMKIAIGAVITVGICVFVGLYLMPWGLIFSGIAAGIFGWWLGGK